MSKTIFILILIFILYMSIMGLILFKNWNDLKTETIVIIIAGIPMFIIPIALNYFVPLPVSPDYINLNRPYLEPKLKIYNSDKNIFNAEYIIENKGKLPAENIKIHFQSDELLRAELDPDKETTLASMSEMRWIPNPIPFTKQNEYHFFDLTIIYTSTINGNKKDFYSTFRTVFHADQITKNNVLQYNESTRHEGKFDLSNLINKLNEKMQQTPSTTYIRTEQGLIVDKKDNSK